MQRAGPSSLLEDKIVAAPNLQYCDQTDVATTINSSVVGRFGRRNWKTQSKNVSFADNLLFINNYPFKCIASNGIICKILSYALKVQKLIQTTSSIRVANVIWTNGSKGLRKCGHANLAAVKQTTLLSFILMSTHQ